MIIELDIQAMPDILSYLKKKVLRLGWTLDVNMANLPVCRYYGLDFEKHQLCWLKWNDAGDDEETILVTHEAVDEIIEFIELNQEVLRPEINDPWTNYLNDLASVHPPQESKKKTHAPVFFIEDYPPNFVSAPKKSYSEYSYVYEQMKKAAEEYDCVMVTAQQKPQKIKDDYAWMLDDTIGNDPYAYNGGLSPHMMSYGHMKQQVKKEIEYQMKMQTKIFKMMQEKIKLNNISFTLSPEAYKTLNIGTIT